MAKIPNLSEQEYLKLRAKVDQHEAWIHTLRERRECRRCHGLGRLGDYACTKCDGIGYLLGRASYRTKDKPAHVPGVPNEERGRLEVYEFLRDKPNRYFAYVTLFDRPESRNGRVIYGTIGTFPGHVLGDIVWRGQPYDVHGFGYPSTRQNLRIEAINGLMYSAVYYESSGDYCRMKVMSSSKREERK